jgi:predicted O-methyltransferase YrrM
VRSYAALVADRLASLREVRDGLLTSGVTRRGIDGRARQLTPVAIGRAEGDALANWVTREGARATLEVGLGFAMATLFICDALLLPEGDARHVAIDAFQHGQLFGGSGVAHLEDAGVRDLVELYEEPSEIVLPRLLARGERFDLAFVDGSHRFESVFLDLVFAGRLLRKHGIVFVDDAQIPSVRKAVDFCLTNLGWQVEERGEEGAAHEWVVMRTADSQVFARPFTEFVDF